MSLLIDSRKFPAWGNIIGQAGVKAALEERTQAMLNGGALPCLGAYDPPGMGKSAVFSSWLCNLAARSKGTDRPITVYSLNCKGNLNITSEEFKDLCGVIASALSGQGDSIINLDEFGTREAKGSGQAQLQAMLSKMGGDAVGGEPIHVLGEGEFVFNPHRLGIVITSWAGGRIPLDLRDRFKQTHDLTLQDYSSEELAEILKLAIARQLKLEGLPPDSVNVHPSAVMLIARAMRGNARQCDNPIAKKIAVRIKAQGGGKYLLDKREAKTIREECGLLPWGITLQEREVLRHLKRGDDTVTGVCSATGMSREQFAIGSRFLRYGHKEACPFQLMKGEDPIKGAFGPLLRTHGARYGITKHGEAVLSLL